jgi:hypothetical protein
LTTVFSYNVLAQVATQLVYLINFNGEEQVLYDNKLFNANLRLVSRRLTAAGKTKVVWNRKHSTYCRSPNVYPIIWWEFPSMRLLIEACLRTLKISSCCYSADMAQSKRTEAVETSLAMVMKPTVFCRSPAVYPL